MTPYGLKKTMSNNIHPHNKCKECCSFVSKKDGRSKARQSKRRELYFLLKTS